MPTSTEKHVALIGADSFAGTHLIPALEAQGWAVTPVVEFQTRAPIRQHSALYDPHDPESLHEAIAGHAAIVEATCWTPRGLGVGEARGEGVRRVRTFLAAAKRARVARALFVSDAATLGAGSERDGASFHVPGSSSNAIVEAKWAMEAELFYGIRDGLDIPILLPTMLIGPQDTEISCRFVADVARGRVPALPKGKVELVDVRDFSRCAAVALSAGRSGRRYPVSAGSMKVEAFVEAVASAVGVDAPRVVRRPLTGSLARGLETGMAMLGRQVGLEEIVRHIGTGAVRDTKARGELSFVARPMRESLSDAIEWYLQVFGWTEQK